MKNRENFVGFSDSGIDEAIQKALMQAGNPIRFEVIETLGSQKNETTRQYQVTIKKLVKYQTL